MKEGGSKAYWQTREAFRSSVPSLRQDSTDAPSLWGDDEDSTDSLTELPPQTVAGLAALEGKGKGRQGEKKGKAKSK